MKIVITETQASIEGKGNVTTIFALLTKCIEAVLLAAIQTGELDFVKHLPWFSIAHTMQKRRSMQW